MNAIHAYVDGLVQGVSFRAYTAEEAGRLGLSGWVRNCPDGRVELMAAGEQALLTELADWLWQGSPYASVTDVTVTPVTAAADLPRPFAIVADATG